MCCQNSFSKASNSFQLAWNARGAGTSISPMPSKTAHALMCWCQHGGRAEMERSSLKLDQDSGKKYMRSQKGTVTSLSTEG